jgi:hypothetical protein
MEALVGLRQLLDMAVVARGKGAGINCLTFDVIFSSGADYEVALYSNAFAKENVAKLLNISPQHVIGTFFVDACNAIRITIDRPNRSGPFDERDVFDAQHQAAIEGMTVPIYAAALSRAPSF